MVCHPLKATCKPLALCGSAMSVAKITGRNSYTLVLVDLPGNVNTLANTWVPDPGKMSSLPYRYPKQRTPG